MPGIAGLISHRPPGECRWLVAQMIASMKHETFYVSGAYSAPELGVYAGWTVLEGSFADCQPILDGHGETALILAGECFAHSKTAAGLIHEYEKRSECFVEDLNGLFSGLVIDRRRRRSSLFNDRYGMERIYYHEGKDGFFFASEAKALLRILPELRAFDVSGLSQFLQYGCTLDSATLFRGVKLLPGASLWSFDASGCAKRRYFAATTWESQAALTPAAFENQFHEVFRSMLPHYFRTDTDLGISLTGGLDTRMIMACRPENARRLVSYTFAGADGATFDARLAARVASQCRVPHHVLRIGREFFARFSSLADRTVYVTDGYFGICGAHEIYLNRLARELAPIRLTGNFGSEILRGVTTFKPLGVSAELLHPDVRSLLANGTPPPRNDVHSVSFAAFNEIPWRLIGVVRAAQSQISLRTPYLDNEVVRLAFQAPAALRNSPTPALQTIRNSASGLDRIPTDTGLLPASRLYSSFAPLWYLTSFKLDYWLNEGLPHCLLPFDGLLCRLGRLLGSHRYLLYRTWFRRELAEYLRQQLTDPQTLQSPLWNRAFLDQLPDSHIRGRRNYMREINMVLTCAAIDRLLLRDTGGSGLAVSVW